MWMFDVILRLLMKFTCFLLVSLLFLPIYGWAQGSISIKKQDTIQNFNSSFTQSHVFIRQIQIVGNKKTKRKIILREMNISEGDRVLVDSLGLYAEANRKRIYNLALFTDVTVTPARVSNDSADLYILVREQWYIFPEISFKLADRNFNVWWKEQNHDIRRANLGVTIKNRNFRGNMESLGATFQIGYTQKFALDYFKPYIDRDQKHGIGASVSFSQNEETFFTTDSNKLEFAKTPRDYIIRQFEAAGVYVYRPGYATRHYVELRYRDYIVDDTITLLNPDYFRNGSRKLQHIELAYRIEHNKVDNWNYPMEGYRFVAHAVTRLGIKGMGFQNYEHLAAGYYHRLWGKKWYAAENFRGRITFPQRQPYALRSAMGSGDDYVRGYEYYVIDGSQFGILRTNFKYELLNIRITNLPVRYLPVIPIRIYPRIFGDAGYAVNKYPGNSYLNNRLLYSGGFGVDIVSAYDFRFRIDYTWNHLGEKGLFLHLNTSE
jgi:outer membrane protein assembly factor BamA